MPNLFARFAGCLVATLAMFAQPLAAAEAAPKVDVYVTPGHHTVNSRQWRTVCERYSSTINRCRTEIFATQVVGGPGAYELRNGWAFNNLTYLPMPRKAWGANPLAATGSWTGDDGRKWRTECDTALTGKDGCRTFVSARVVQPGLDAQGRRTFTVVTTTLFNNMVRFGEPQPLPPGPTDCSLTIDGVAVKLAANQLTATAVKASGTRATVTMVERVPGTACEVAEVFRDTTGRVGYAGTKPADRRRQDDGTTPAGQFAIGEAFGLKPNPGTSLPWRTPTARSYWVLDPASAHYNQWRESDGSFRTDSQNSERLVSFPGQYDYAAVIDFNRWPTDRRKGGAIFLHVNGKGATAGCVSVSAASMVKFLTAASPGDAIAIA